MDLSEDVYEENVDDVVGYDSDLLYIDDAKYPLIDDSEPEKPFMCYETCKVIAERYHIAPRKEFMLPYEEEQYRLRCALMAERFGNDDKFDYKTIWKSDEYVKYKKLSDGPAEQFKPCLPDRVKKSFFGSKSG